MLRDPGLQHGHRVRHEVDAGRRPNAKFPRQFEDPRRRLGIQNELRGDSTLTGSENRPISEPPLT